MVGVLVAETIHPTCMCEGGGRGGEAGAPSDLKMPLENGRADEKVSRGQASERAVCVCEAVSVEMGARRPPLPTNRGVSSLFSAVCSARGAGGHPKWTATTAAGRDARRRLGTWLDFPLPVRLRCHGRARDFEVMGGSRRA